MMWEPIGKKFDHWFKRRYHRHFVSLFVVFVERKSGNLKRKSEKQEEQNVNRKEK